MSATVARLAALPFDAQPGERWIYGYSSDVLKSVELMTTHHIPMDGFREGEGFGLGFAVVKDVGMRGKPGSVGEYGWGGAYHSSYWVDPKEQLVVVYLTQLMPAGTIDDQEKLRTLICQAIAD